MSPNPSSVSAPASEDNPGCVRDRIFNTARELFYRHGIRAVGVEAIAAEAGTTKMSLYRHFASKDELLAECLREQDREFWAWWDGVVAPHENPRAQIEALFGAFTTKACKGEFSRGCPLANAAVEVTEDEHPARHVVLDHHAKIRRRLRKLCREMGAHDPEALGDALVLLMNGSYVWRLVFASSGPAKSVAETARILLDTEALGAPPKKVR